MPNVAGVISETHRASRAWMRIQRDPTSITVIRGGAAQTAQTVRVEFSPLNMARQSQGMTANQSRRDLIVFGVRNHPDATVLDTNLKRGDRFTINSTIYVVTDVNDVVPGEIQADCERSS